VPIPSILRGYLAEHRKHKFALGQRSGFVFGETPGSPFNYDVTYDRGMRIWKKAKRDWRKNWRTAGLGAWLSQTRQAF